MAGQRVSKLQKRILRLLVAEHHRTQGGTSLSHYELVKALGGYSYKGNISQSLRTVEGRGWITIGRTPGGRAEYLEQSYDTDSSH